VLQILDETLETGAVIAGACRLSRILGEGGMGVVWAAHEMRTNRPVALKFLRAGREVDPKNQQRFLREARAAMGVVHPNIARVEAVLETDAGVPFMVMELLEGESLRSLLDRRGMLMPVECARLMVQVVDAVAAAHASGVVHRDLKPENVFIVNGSYVRVLDFGIAKMMVKDGATVSAVLTSTGMLLGTPLYMAPE
jgi:eukaryotic-like serine/threonine-protein kinase